MLKGGGGGRQELECRYGKQWLIQREFEARGKGTQETYSLGLWGEEASLGEEDTTEYDHNDLTDSLEKTNNPIENANNNERRR